MAVVRSPVKGRPVVLGADGRVGTLAEEEARALRITSAACIVELRGAITIECVDIGAGFD